MKRAKTAAARTAKSLDRLQEQLEILKFQRHQDKAGVQAREKAVRATEVAFAKKKSAAERAEEKLQKKEKRQRDIVQKAAQGAQIRE